MIDRRRPEPLYIQVKQDIIDQIERGQIKIGDKLMSETEMQQHYGVARPTIRAALSDLVTEGCIRKEHGLGTFCIAYPKKEKPVNVDVIVNQSDTYFMPYVLRGISQVLDDNGGNLLLHDNDHSMERTIELLKRVLDRGTDGVIMPAFFDSYKSCEIMVDLLRQYDNAKVPIVMMLGDMNRPWYLSSLSIDNFIHITVDVRYGGEIAAKYLLDCGHRRILALLCGSYAQKGNRRLIGFYDAVNRVPDARAFEYLGDANFGPEVLRLVREEGVTAIQCYNDHVAVQCLRLLSENGIRVPEDVSLIGFDDTDLARNAIPSLTTITHPKSQLGMEAANSILRRIRNPLDRQEDVIYRPGLVIRYSVKQVE